MLGRLPKLYRWRTGALVLLAGILGGGWIAYATTHPDVVPVGALMGGLAGILIAYLVLHPASASPRKVRIRHRR